MSVVTSGSRVPFKISSHCKPFQIESDITTTLCTCKHVINKNINPSHGRKEIRMVSRPFGYKSPGIYLTRSPKPCNVSVYLLNVSTSTWATSGRPAYSPAPLHDWMTAITIKAAVMNRQMSMVLSDDKTLKWEKPKCVQPALRVVVAILISNYSNVVTHTRVVRPDTRTIYTPTTNQSPVTPVLAKGTPYFRCYYTVGYCGVSNNSCAGVIRMSEKQSVDRPRIPLSAEEMCFGFENIVTLNWVSCIGRTIPVRRLWKPHNK